MPINDSDHNSDLISNLPDDLLRHIPWFLPIKDALATSMISTRWRHLFPTIPNLLLDFDEKQFRHPSDSSLLEKFIDFVLNIVLRDTKALVDELWIYFRQWKPRRKFEMSWIHAAARLKVECLVLECCYSAGLEVPCCEFFDALGPCSRLNYLKIRNYKFRISPDDLCSRSCSPFPLRNLKNLHLKDVVFEKAEVTFPKVLHGCPILKELVLDSCRFETQTLYINFPTLKRLRLKFYRYYGYHERSEVVLDVPLLKGLKFKIYGYGVSVSALSEMKFLRYVELEVGPFNHESSRDYFNSQKFISKCYRTKSLVLCARAINALHHSGCKLPLFPNLEHVTMDVSSYGDQYPCSWEAVLPLLRLTPNLSSAAIYTEGREHKEGDTPELALIDGRVPDCLTSHLTKIYISTDIAGKEFLTLVDYLLEHANHSAKVEIGIDSVKEENISSFKEKLEELPHWSTKSCKVIFVKDVCDSEVLFIGMMRKSLFN